jgi:radical SAM superfamily enzyme YgiQ (UPF0313 family)
MRILLVGLRNFREIRRGTLTPPIRIATLAAVLNELGNDVDFIDLKMHPVSDLEEKARAGNYGLFFVFTGISFTNLSGVTLKSLLEVCAALGKGFPGVPLGVGGTHAQLAQEKLLENKEVAENADFIVYGEENVFPELLAGGRLPKDLSGARGIIFNSGGKSGWVKNPPMPFMEDLDSLPMPLFEIMELDRYKKHSLWVTRGCPRRCAFCSVPPIYGKTYRKRSAKKVADEMEYVIKRFGRKRYTSCDDDLFVDKKWLLSLCDELIARKLGVEWSLTAAARADELDPQLLAKMREAGCREIGMGIESGDAGVLKAVKKDVTPETLEKGIRTLKQSGIRAQAFIIVGLPGESRESVENTKRFLKRAKPDNIVVAHALPHPNTPLWDWVEENGEWLSPPFHTLFAHDKNFAVPEPCFETAEFPKAERMKAMRELFSLKMATYPLHRLPFAIAIYLKDNGLRCWGDAFLIIRDWAEWRLPRQARP